jgi:ubiquinone/menaquinone biosynthesis C-methylase UbiE
MTSLVDPSVATRWDKSFSAGADKSYPNVDLVRLEQWFFEHRPGKMLEYGFGSGANLIHLLTCGHQIEAVDVAPSAARLVESKLAERPELADRVGLHILDPDAESLPFEDGTFDYVVCISVLSLLGTTERIRHALSEFARVLVPGGKAILDVNSSRSDFAMQAVPVGNDIYRNSGAAGDEAEVSMYCPAEPESFAELVAGSLEVVDVGYSGHKYLDREINEFIVLARKPA